MSYIKIVVMMLEDRLTEHTGDPKKNWCPAGLSDRKLTKFYSISRKTFHDSIQLAMTKTIRYCKVCKKLHWFSYCTLL